MPDWLTHVLVGWGVFNLLTLRRSDIDPFKSMIIVGSVLPDLWHIRLICYQLGLDLTWQLYVFHTPLGSTLMSLLIGLAFLKDDVWKRGTLFLMVGVSIHLVLDVMLKHIDGGHYLLFPVSWDLFELSIFWPESFTFLAIALSFWCISYLLIKRLNSHADTNTMR